MTIDDRPHVLFAQGVPHDHGQDQPGAYALSTIEKEVGLNQGAQESFASKLQTYQQEYHDGTVQNTEMMNVAVVSDIGWKTGQEPTSEDVWAQYDFKCAVSDVLEYAEYLGMDIKEDAHLLWIADEALQAPEPQVRLRLHHPYSCGECKMTLRSSMRRVGSSGLIRRVGCIIITLLQGCPSTSTPSTTTISSSTCR
jgi:hypothetical protein